MGITDKNLPDMQKTTSGFYKKAINKVGVRNIPVVISVDTKSKDKQNVLFKVSSYCSLDSETKGINMSRISRTINDNISHEELMRQDIVNLVNSIPNNNSISSFKKLAEELKKAHNSNDVYVKAKGTYILHYKTPMTNIESQQPVYIEIESIIKDDRQRTYLTVESSEMSLCPCSREMSRLFNNITDKEALEISNLSKELQNKLSLAGFGAHNQRSHIRIKVELKEDSDYMWIEDLKKIAEMSSSQPTYTVLKRPDEKFLTETSYCGGYFDDNHVFNKVENTGAKFVEDIVRDCAKFLDKELDKRILDYVVVANNEESIHSGDIMATAILTAGRELS